ncbi:hypothetical protein [Flavobacterium nackdongense]|jgi:hypothetical protein|uniref:Uncharacterized protein n=1 Tax=Flavobacterium nackdongense TaxID=2547394 RepID=A0A4P6Y5A5_9FLAO|nr:hypothetical protein [Flavobacterium nackdongense]QBN17261.1 hypothetical protein E1750_00050 [Flavobacterium nackdongense]
MNIQSIICWQCHKKVDKEGNTQFFNDQYKHRVNIDNTRFYQFTCPEGHLNFAIQGNNKFEILYELGIEAYNDEFFREAVTNFASAVERFHEYCIMLFLAPKSLEEFNIAVSNQKVIAKYSERQYGAFFMLFLKLLNFAPPVLDEKFLKKHMLKLSVDNPINFRNNIIHQGYIPTKEECISYAKITSFYINEILEQIYTWNADIIKNTNKFFIDSLKSEIKKEKNINGDVLIMKTRSFVGASNFYENSKKEIDFNEHLYLMNLISKRSRDLPFTLKK